MPQLTNYPNVQIDSTHSRAICEEVGYRLRQFLRNDPAEHPRHLQLLGRMARRDFDGAPPIVPFYEEGLGNRAYRSSTASRRPVR